jgi:hypothetical protein
MTARMTALAAVATAIALTALGHGDPEGQGAG